MHVALNRNLLQWAVEKLLGTDILTIDLIIPKKIANFGIYAFVITPKSHENYQIFTLSRLNILSII